MNVKIDHVTVCGRDLEQMRRAFTEIGLASEYGGPHANGLTHMAVAGFADGSYLELIAPVDALDDTVAATGMISGWTPLMTGESGAGAWAARASGIEQQVAQLRKSGIEVRGPERGGRTRPDGTRLEWAVAMVGPGAAGSVLPFMIEDRTARKLRVGSPMAASKAGFSGVAVVVIGVRELGGASALFQQAYGWNAPEVEEHPEFGARLAHFAAAPVMLAEPLGNSWLRARLERFGECPAGFVLQTAKSPTEQTPSEETWECLGMQIRWFDESKLRARVGVLRSARVL